MLISGQAMSISNQRHGTDGALGVSRAQDKVQNTSETPCEPSSTQDAIHFQNAL